MSTAYGTFDEDIDKYIFDTLTKVGLVNCVDRDYDLFYELLIANTKYLCYIDFIRINFEVNDTVTKFVSTDKLKAWKDIDEKEKILIIHYNEYDKGIYFSRIEEILRVSNIDNAIRCAYRISKNDRIETLV